MCFSEEVSWATFVIGILGTVALHKPYPALSIFFGSVVVMQLYEALLWRERGRCTATNDAVSKIAALTNHAQPLVLYFACRAFMNPVHGLEPLTLAALGVYTIAAAVVTKRFIERETCTELTAHGLEWKWNAADPMLYALYLASVGITLYSYFGSSMITWSTLVSFALSYLLYKDAKMVGSMWCFFGAWLPWLLLENARVVNA